MQPFRPLPGRRTETGLKRRGGEVIGAGIDPDAPETREERFEFGLDCLLDGIEARIPRSRKQTPQTSS